MTSVLATGSADSAMANLSLSPSATPGGINTQTDALTNVIPTSSKDVATTPSQFEYQSSESQLPFSIGPSSQLDDGLSDISTVQNSGFSSEPVSADVTSSDQSVQPTRILSSPTDSATEYSTNSISLLSSTPTLPQSVSVSKTDVLSSSDNVEMTSGLLSSTANVPSSSNNVIVTTSETPIVPKVTRTMDMSASKQGITSKSSGNFATISPTVSASSVITSSSIIPGILPRETTPYSGGNNKDNPLEPRPGIPNSTILYIVIPVCLLVFIILIIVLVACLRRRKNTKKPTTNQSPDLWVNTRPEISLVPTTPAVIENQTETVPGFKAGDIVCQVVYPFTAQLDGQMTLTEKELIKVLEKADNGWWRGTSQSGEQSGWFPGCYVEEFKAGSETGTLEGSQSKGKSRVSSFMLKKRERIRRRSAAAVSPLSVDTTALGMSTSSTMPALNSAEISKFSDGKVFRALFAYQGSSKGELSIEEGDIVRGWEKDRNGWMHGRKVMTGEEGWFPAVYVDEVPSDTSSISGESTLSGPIMYDQLAPNKHRQSGQEWLGIEHRAIHPYTGNSDSDLSFEAGDIIIVFDTLDNGWWLGSRGDDVGWLPGSYLEIADSGREDESRSDVSSLLSSHDDRNRTLDEDLSHLTSSQSLSSNLSDSKPKPKPARKAPPPPKLKPLKIPVREDNQGSIQKTELNTVNLKTPEPEPQYAVIKKGDNSKGSDSKPRRPAPPPPPKRGSESQPVSPDQKSTTVASSAASSLSENKLKPGEKPVLPKRFAKPKVIRLPRQSSRLQNLAVNSRPSARAAPPRPPPPKIPKNSKVRSSRSLSGIYSKSKESTFGKALSSSVKDLQENDNSQTDSVSVVDETNKPKKVPPVVVPMKIKPESKNENNSKEPQVRNAFAKAKKSESIGSDPEDANRSEPSTSPINSPRVLLYPLETGPTVSSPVIAPMKPPVIPPVKRQSFPPVRPAKGPRAEPPARPSIGPTQKTLVIPVPPPVVPRISNVDVSLVQSSDSEKASDLSQSPKLVETENPEPKSPSKSQDIPQQTTQEIVINRPDNIIESFPRTDSPDDSLMKSQEVDNMNTSSDSSSESSKASTEISSESSRDSPEPSPEPSPVAPLKLPRTSPPKDVSKVVIAPEAPVVFTKSADEVPLESPPVVSSVPTPESPQISLPMNLHVQKPPSETQTSSGPASPQVTDQNSGSLESPDVTQNESLESPDVPQNLSLESQQIDPIPKTSSPSDSDHTSPSNDSFDSTKTSSLPKAKPIPPPKPNRVPPPVFPKPKIKPKPSQLTVFLANPAPQKEPTPVRNVVNLQSPVREDLKLVEEEHLNKEVSVENNTLVETSEHVSDNVPKDSENDYNDEEKDSDEQGDKINRNGDAFEKGDNYVAEGDNSDNKGGNLDVKGDNSDVKGGNILGSISDSDDEQFERNCDISSDSSATDNSSSIASDTLDLGSEIGESDDHTLDSSLDIITNQHFIDDPHQDNNNESKMSEIKTDLKQDNTPEKTDNEPAANGGLKDISNGLNESLENESEKPQTGKMDSDGEQDSSEPQAEENGLPNGRKSDKPVPLPRSGLSPSKEGSPTPPSRPPPPKSPGSATYRKVNQGTGDKGKKQTLRQATKSYTPVGKGELAFEEGSLIKEMSKAIGRPGWCIGMLADGTTGLYPTSHVGDAELNQSEV